jgi:hypothetical protein
MELIDTLLKEREYIEIIEIQDKLNYGHQHAKMAMRDYASLHGGEAFIDYDDETLWRKEAYEKANTQAQQDAYVQDSRLISESMKDGSCRFCGTRLLAAGIPHHLERAHHFSPERIAIAQRNGHGNNGAP